MTARKTTKSKTAAARTAATTAREHGPQTKQSQTITTTKPKKPAPKPAAKAPSKTKASEPKTASSHNNKTANQLEPHAKGLNANPVNRDMLLFALPHPIFVLDRAQRFIYISAAAESFFEISTPMLKRMALDDIVNFSSPLRALVNQVLETGTTVNEYAVEISTKRFENAKLVDVYAGPIPEQPELTVVMLLQRTMAQMIERQLTHRAAARSVSGMAAVLAHEIKNPLSGIRGAAQLLEHNLSDEDRVLSRLICTETDRITKLVDRMEVFGDERPVSTEPVNIHEILAHVRTLAQAGFAKDVQILEDYDPSLPAVPGDRDQLIQAFLNLLKNAVEALSGNSKNDRVTIRTAFRPGVRLTLPGATTRVSLPLMIQIEDNGKGIPNHLKPHLFDPFVTTKIGGTGLGLALVAKIIGDHGGVIECESDSNRTIFRVLLALQPAPAPLDAPQDKNETGNN